MISCRGSSRKQDPVAEPLSGRNWAMSALYAKAARHAKDVGFGGVEVCAGHGFLRSQFLSRLFNH